MHCSEIVEKGIRVQLVLVYVFIYSHECHKFKFPCVVCTDCAEKLHVVSDSQLRQKLHSTERGGWLWVVVDGVLGELYCPVATHSTS